MDDRRETFATIFSKKGRAFFSDNPEKLPAFMSDFGFDKADIVMIRTVVSSMPSTVSEMIREGFSGSIQDIAKAVSRNTGLDITKLMPLLADMAGTESTDIGDDQQSQTGTSTSDTDTSTTGRGSDTEDKPRDTEEGHSEYLLSPNRADRVSSNVAHYRGMTFNTNRGFGTAELASGDKKSIRVVIPEDIMVNGWEYYRITSIKAKAFSDDNRMESVEIPPSITEVPEGCFSRCRNLKTVVFPEGLKTIGAHAFEDCSTLENVNYPPSLSSIGEYAFHGCSKLVSRPPAHVSCGEMAFDEEEKTNVVPPVQTVGRKTHKKLRGLLSLIVFVIGAVIAFAAPDVSNLDMQLYVNILVVFALFVAPYLVTCLLDKELAMPLQGLGASACALAVCIDLPAYAIAVAICVISSFIVTAGSLEKKDAGTFALCMAIPMTVAALIAIILAAVNDDGYDVPMKILICALGYVAPLLVGGVLALGAGKYSIPLTIGGAIAAGIMVHTMAFDIHYLYSAVMLAVALIGWAVFSIYEVQS